MPFRFNPQTIIGVVDEKLTNKPELRADVRTLAVVMQTVSHIQPADCDSASFKRKLQEAVVAAISAAGRLLDNASVSALQASSITPLDRFAILHFASVQRALLRGLDSVAGKTDYEADKTGTEGSIRSHGSRSLREDIQRTMELVMGLDVPYTLAVNPASQLGSYYEEQVRAFSTLIGLLRGGWRGASEFSKSIEVAMRDYNAWASSRTDAAEAVRSYLNYEQQQAQRNIVADDVRGLSLALQNWLRANDTLSERRKENWRAYRETLSKLPDDKITMFDESFGVRKVFVQPVATYKVAGVKRVSDAAVADVAGLIGTLISDRVGGDDLILLAGGPGSGKSTLCRILAAELAANEEVHPVFLRLRRLQDSHDVRGFIETHLQSLGLIDRVADLASVPNLVLILDGFDELVMASRTKLREFFNALKEDLSTGPLRHAKAIVSGRDTLFPNGLGLPTGAHVISLQPFDRSRIAAWGAKWREQHSRDTAKSFYPENLVSEDKGRGKKTSPLEHLVSWPLTLHLVARAHTSGSIDLKTNNVDEVEKAVLYRSIVADTALRQDEQAGGRGRLNPQQMRKFVQAIAWEMYSTGREALDVTEGLPILRSILPEAMESDLTELADVTIVNQPELTKGEETGFEFVHKSFSEYFAAETIATKIEEVCFRVAQWGGEEETWRMSAKEATTALAGLFAVRLLTAEVQEMLEPMLDDFLTFLRGPSAYPRPTPELLASNLERKLLRFEALLQEFAGGGLLKDVTVATRSNRLVISELESFGNYASALLFIAVALTHRQNAYGGKSERRVRIPPATLVRLLHIVLAGEIQIDRPYAERGLRLIDARRPGGESTEVHFPPVAPSLLEDVRGLESHLEEAITALNSQKVVLELENILLTFATTLLGSHGDSIASFRHARYNYRYHHDAGYNDYLQRIISVRSRMRYEDVRYFEERAVDILERLRASHPDALRLRPVEEMIMRIREFAYEGRHRGMGNFELYERAEAMLRHMIDMDTRPVRRPKIQTRPKES
ncbi:NACHT domain-containing protein [Azospirillum halopraeferens]|uniref:NACHT domain-containing protein n=1 Tax=Azospirillum halopraeferens TaxID=34010 RepID=UPI00048BD12B|nr:NACHT domain-containing protein [Azospirillum halopraeferens]